MAGWTASAKWAAGPALDGQRAMPLALRLSEGLGVTRRRLRLHAQMSKVILQFWMFMPVMILR
jgi:hypothetical protein